METARKSFLDLYRDAREIFGDENIDSLSEYLKLIEFQKEFFYSMTPFKKKVYDYHLKEITWKFNKKSLYESYDIARVWGLLMEWAIARGYKIPEIAEVTLDVLKAFSRPFRLYLPFMILVNFWNKGEELYLLRRRFFEDFDELSNHINYEEFQWVAYINEMLSKNETVIDKEIRGLKLLKFVVLYHRRVRYLSTKEILKEFEVRRPKATNKLLLKWIIFSGGNNGQTKCHREAMEVAVIMQRMMRPGLLYLSEESFHSLEEMLQTILILYESKAIPEILDEFWKYSDQLNC